MSEENQQATQTEVLVLPRIMAELLERNAELIELARSVRVDSEETDAAAKLLVQRIAGGIKEREAVVDPYVADALALHRRACARRSALIAPLESAKAIVSDKVLAYGALARREAELKRIELEAAARKEEERRKRADAFAAAKAGDKATAAAIRAEPIVAPRIAVAPETAKVSGTTERTTWKAEVTDLAALVEHVAQHPELLYLIEPAESSLNAIARAQRDKLNIPGVRAFEVRSLASRAHGG
jgi:hypothetical protein